MTEENNEERELMSRRTVAKLAVGGAVGAAVWAEPTIRGLARRPAYAAGGSQAQVIFEGRYELDGDIIKTKQVFDTTGTVQLDIRLEDDRLNLTFTRTTGSGPIGDIVVDGQLRFTLTDGSQRISHFNNQTLPDGRFSNNASPSKHAQFVDIFLTCQ